MRRVYHFLNRKYGLQNIRRRRLKIANINELNDPFELLGVAFGCAETSRCFERTKAQLAENRGILCFSENWGNPVQWSHYADRHRGLCLGFDVSFDLTPVTYVSKRLNPGPFAVGGKAALGHMLKVLTTKFSHWRYEQEHRFFVTLETKDAKGLYFFGFSRELALKEVVLGINCTITQGELRRALGTQSADVEIFKARLSARTFRVLRQKFELPPPGK